MSKLNPEAYLTIAEQTDLKSLHAEGAKQRQRHTELVAKMKKGLTDEEKLELRAVTIEFNRLYDEAQRLLAKNPLLPHNIIKAIEERESKDQAD